MTGYFNNFLSRFETVFEANLNPQDHDIQQMYAETVKALFDALDPSEYQDAYLDLEERLNPNAITVGDDGLIAELREAFRDDLSQPMNILYVYWAMKNGCIPTEALKMAYTKDEMLAISEQAGDATAALLEVKAEREQDDALTLTKTTAIQARIKQLEDPNYITQEIVRHGDYVSPDLVRANLASEYELLNAMGRDTANGYYYLTYAGNVLVSTLTFPVAACGAAPFLLLPPYVFGFIAQQAHSMAYEDPNVAASLDSDAKKYIAMTSTLATTPQLGTSLAFNKLGTLCLNLYGRAEAAAMTAATAPGPYAQTGTGMPPAAMTAEEAEATAATSTARRRSPSPQSPR